MSLKEEFRLEPGPWNDAALGRPQHSRGSLSSSRWGAPAFYRRSQANQRSMSDLIRGVSRVRLYPLENSRESIGDLEMSNSPNQGAQQDEDCDPLPLSVSNSPCFHGFDINFR